jgi:hypothetical protein
MSSADFPDVNTDAISALASSLQLITSALADIGIGTRSLRDAVIQHEQWQGSAAQGWQTVVTDRIGDAGLTNDVMGSASSLLTELASDLHAERQTYNRISTQYIDSMPLVLGGPEPSRSPFGDPQLLHAMSASADRANGLLDKAGRDLLYLATLAGDIHAQPAGNRTPGVPSGTNRNAASLQLLVALLGSVRDNQSAGSAYEKMVLRELGLNKTNDLWREDPAFEGKLTPGGLAKGTIPDVTQPGSILEIKSTPNKLKDSFQLRLQVRWALRTGRPLWIITRSGSKVSESVVRGAESTGGGVIYRSGPGEYQDGSENKVDVKAGGNKLSVSGYRPKFGVPAAGGDPMAAGPPVSPDEPDEPTAPLDPKAPSGPKVPGGGGAPVIPDEGEPEVPGMPEMPEMPAEPEIPIVIP